MTTQNDVPTFDDLTRIIADEMLAAANAVAARYGLGPIDLEAMSQSTVDLKDTAQQFLMFGLDYWPAGIEETDFTKA